MESKNHPKFTFLKFGANVWIILVFLGKKQHVF